MKGVFEISGASRCDDQIAERYHFPHTRLRAGEACLGDWINHREPGSVGGRKAYMAAGLMQSIDPDHADSALFYARIEGVIEFDRPVPHRDPDGRFLEGMLPDLNNTAIAGRAPRGRSVRAIDGVDFGAIVNRRLVETLSPDHAIPLELDPRTSMLRTPPRWLRHPMDVASRDFRSIAPWAAQPSAVMCSTHMAIAAR